MADSEIVVRVKTDGVALAESSLRRLGAVGSQAELATNRLTSATNKSAHAFTISHGAMQAMQAVGIVTFLAGTIKAVTDLSDSWTNMTNKLVNANSANEKMAVVQQRVFDIAQRTRTDLSATATLYARVERSVGQYGYTAQQSARMTETVNKAMAVSGATAAEAGAAIVQLSQGLQSGVLRGDEFRSVAEQAPRLLQAMSNSLGVTTGELRKLANEGKLTSDVVVKSILAAGTAIDTEFAKTIPTFSQNMAIATNNLTKFVGESQSAAGGTRMLGQALVTLSENAGTVVDVMGLVAAVVGTRLVAAMVQKAVATNQARVADAQAAAQQAATNAVMQSSVGISAQKATADRVAASTALQYARAQAIVLKGTAEELTAKGALTAATVTYRAAVMTEISAKQALGVALEGATAATQRFAGATALAKGALNLLGGPLGIAMLAATAIWQYSSAAKQAATDSKNYGDEASNLKERLDTMTEAQLRATAATAGRQLVELKEQLADAAAEEAKAAKIVSFYTAQLERRKKSGRDVTDTERYLKLASDDHAIAAEKLESANKRVADTQDLVTAASFRALPAIQRAIQLYNDLRNVSTAVNIEAPIDRLDKALKSANQELDVSTRKASGNGRQASILQKIYGDLGKDVDAFSGSIERYKNGSLTAANASTEEEKKLMAVADAYGKVYDANQKALEIKKGPALARQAEAYQEAWDKAYARVEARGLTSLDRIDAQEKEQLRQMNDKASKANASVEERENARKNIQERFARERLDLVDKYSPEKKMVRDYELATKEINQLNKLNHMDSDETNRAKLAVDANYYNQRIQLAKDRAVSDVDALKGVYDPVQAVRNQEAESLAALVEAHDLKLVEDDRYYELRRQIQAKAAEDAAKAENETLLTGIQSVSSAADSMAGVLDMMGAKASAAYKVMFALSKSFAIAQATMNLNLAISQALSDPTALTPMQKFANMAAIAAAGAGLVQQIVGASMQGMAHDGITDIPREGTWLLQKGERVLSSQQNADFTNFMRSGGSGGGGSNGRSVIINQTINVSGNGDEALSRATQQAAKDGAEQGYNKVLQDTTSRGPVSRSIGR